MTNSIGAERTREAIRQTFLLLLKEKPLSEIDVKEIAARTPTSRTTFYRHYRDVYNLLCDCYLAYCFDDFVPPSEQVSADDLEDHLYREALSAASRLREYGDLYRLCLSVDDLLFQREFDASVFSVAYQMAEQRARNLGLTDANSLLPVAMVAELCADLQTSIFEKWGQGGCVESPEAVAEAVHKGCLGFLQSMFKTTV